MKCLGMNVNDHVPVWLLRNSRGVRRIPSASAWLEEAQSSTSIRAGNSRDTISREHRKNMLDVNMERCSVVNYFEDCSGALGWFYMSPT